MKAIGIVGSPRKNGNVDALVQTVLDGAEEAAAAACSSRGPPSPTGAYGKVNHKDGALIPVQ